MSGPVPARFALSPQQHLAWLSRWGSGEAGAVVAVEGGVDSDRLVEAWERVVGRHEVLRTSLTTVGELGFPLQVVGEAGVVRLELLGGDEATRRFRLTGPCVVVDPMSFGFIVADLAALYEGRREGLPEALQYLDYAGWLNELSRDRDAEEARAFWGRGSGHSGVPDGGAFTRMRGRTPRRSLPVVAAETDLLTAWLVLAGARLGDDGDRVWVRGAGRSLADLQGAVGPYSQWLPLRTAVIPEEPSGLLRDRVRSRWDAMRAHEAYFGGRVADRAVGFWHEQWDAIAAGGLTWALEDTWRECEGLSLVLRTLHGVRGLEVWLEFDEQEWSSGEAERLLGQFVRVVERLADRGTSDLPVGDLTVAPTPALVAAVPTEGVIASALRAARDVPSRVGVQSEDRAWRYGELMGRAGRVAGAVRAVAGTHRGARVGVCVGQSLEGIAALLGVWGAGAVAVLLEPTAPEARLAAQIRAAELTALVADEDARLAAAWDGPLVDVARRGGVWEGADGWTLVQGAPDEAAYVIFTSGTTGVPKGVEVTHGALGAYAAALRERLGADGERWELVTTLAADLGYSSVLGALTSRGTLVVRTPAEATDWRALGGCDYLKITPGHLQALLTAAGGNAVDVLPAKGVLIGGEAWGWELWERIQGLRPDMAIWNHYGPTETTIGVVAGRVDRSASVPEPLLGAPLRHAWLYVLDPSGNRVLDGAAGELWVGGPAVARGYVNQPAATAERFRPDPWGPCAGGRMYGTGDCVRRTSDGRFQFLGRIDGQVKVRGHRVEPGEVENLLRRHPAISQVAVIGTPGPDGRTRLVACLVGPAEGRPVPAELESFLAAHLPRYMIPAEIIWLPQLPLLPNGKVDRSRLADASDGQAPTPVPYERPHPGVEATLAEVWAATLGLERVGRLDNFFALGGDSIASIQVVARARASGLRLTVDQIFRYPALADLAQVATAQAPGPPPEPARSGPVPLTPIQRWFFAGHGPEPHHYNQAFWLEVAEPVDRAALERALFALVQRHDALRLRFLPTLAGWDQELVEVPGEVDVEIFDFSALPEPAAEAAATLAAARLQGSINLGRPPLMRMGLFRFPSGDERLLWIAHHLIVDVVSWTILFEQVQRAYLQVLADEAVDLGPAPAPFAQWARSLAPLGRDLAHGSGGELVAADRSGVNPLPAGDRPTRAGVIGDEVTQHRCFSEGETQDLLEVICPTYGLQPVEAVLALLMEAVATWSGNESLLVDVEWHGRERGEQLDVAGTVGWFTVRTPVLLTRPPGSSPGDLLRAVKEQVRLLERQQGEYAGGVRSGAHPEISFNFLGQFDRAFPRGSPFRCFAEAGPGSRAASTPRRFRFSVNAGVVRRRLEVDWTYDPSVDRADEIDRLFLDLRSAARAFANACRGLPRVYTPSDFGAASLTQDDVDRLFQQWNESFS